MIIGKLMLRLGFPVVVVVGDLMIDQWLWGIHYRKTREYGQPLDICDIERSEISCGGATNVARHLASLGARTCLVGVVGEDMWGTELRSMCNRINIVPHIAIDSDRTTTVKTRVIDTNHNCYKRFDQESRTPLSSGIERHIIDAINHLAKHATVFVVSDYHKGVATQLVTQAAIDTNVPVIADLKRFEQYGKYKGAALLKVSDADFNNIQLASLADCASLLITRGSEGCELVNNNEIQEFAAWKVSAEDAVGAGDATVAGIALSLGSGLDLEEAVDIGNLAGAVSVTIQGTRQGITRADLREVAGENLP